MSYLEQKGLLNRHIGACAIQVNKQLDKDKPYFPLQLNK